MKILFLNPVGTIGGAERVLLDLIASLRVAAPGADVHLLTSADGPLVPAARALGVTTTTLPFPPELGELGDSGLESSRLRTVLSLARRTPRAAWSAWQYARRLAEVIESLQPEVVHSNGIKFHLLTRLARLRTIPVVWHVHDFLGRRPLMARGLRWASSAVSGVIAISQAVGRDCQATLPSLPVSVVLNALDTDRFRPGPGDGSWLDRLAQFHPAGRQVLRIGLVATFARWKGQDFFLRAARQLLPVLRQWDVRCYIIGGPIYQTRGSQWSEQELLQQGADLVAAGRLGFIGFGQDTAEVYRALDIVVHASTQPEPFGLTIVEAMACGRPVIVANSGGATELFTEGRDALGVSPGQVDALAAAIERLIRDPEQRDRLGIAARQTALARFGRQRLGPEVLAAYRRFGVVVPSKLLREEVALPCFPS